MPFRCCFYDTSTSTLGLFLIVFASEFKLHAEELERWFTKIDHIFEHTRIPKIGEVLAPFYKISIDRQQHHHLPLVSHINYKYYETDTPIN